MQNNNNNNSFIYFDPFGVENIAKYIKAFIINNNNNNNNNNNIITNTFRMQAYNSIKCGYFLLVLLILCLKENFI